jgi:hypothetical protein
MPHPTQQAQITLEVVNQAAMMTITAKGVLVSVPLDTIRQIIEDRYQEMPFRLDSSTSWNRVWNNVTEDIETGD